ncbi:MAG TPA: histidine kinase [Cyclobacteriaceae bacterium]|nr:histidine kinase [Cyclobacteriaceae bacterium]
MISYKKRLYWTLQILIWTSYALLQIIVYSIEKDIPTRRVIFFIIEALLCFGVTHVFRFVVNKLKWLNLSIPKMIPRVLASVFAMGFAIYFLRVPPSVVLDVVNVQRLALDPKEILGFSLWYVFLMFVWTLFYFTYHYIERYNKSLKYEASMIEFELNNLKNQLNPHFIFNALNSIRALVDENPMKSKQAINQLSNILRNSLTFEKKGLTKFDDEMKIVNDYLGLESIRFEERLKTEIEIQPGSNSFLVPPFMIQTLVENGIKHGVSKLTQGGIIQVKTQVEKNRLKIQIRNSGHMVNGAKRTKSGGTGIANTKHRLKLLYGDDASFRIVNENNNFVLTEIIIPQAK